MTQLVPKEVLQLCVAERDIMLIKRILVHVGREMLISSRWIRFGHHLGPFRDVEVVDLFDVIIFNKLRLEVRDLKEYVTNLHTFMIVDSTKLKNSNVVPKTEVTT